VTTKLTIEGPRENIEVFRTCHIKMKEGDEAFHFDLSTVIPRPEVLEGTVSGSNEETLPQNLKAKEETGFLNWYDWSVENWGTKWNSYEFNWVEQRPEKLVFTFETAWSTPEPVLQKLVRMYPMLKFSTMSFDECWNWASIGELHPKGMLRFNSVVPTPSMYKAVYGVDPEVEPLDNDEETKDPKEVH